MVDDAKVLPRLVDTSATLETISDARTCRTNSLKTRRGDNGGDVRPEQ